MNLLSLHFLSFRKVKCYIFVYQFTKYIATIKDMKNRTIKYSLPIRIVDSNRPLEHFNLLLQSQDDQIALYEPDLVSLSKGDYFILDFGEEKCGGVRILTGVNGSIYPNMNIRIRFGESISESCAELGEKSACNDHSTRDFLMEIPALSDQHFGETGFRFVRIDILEDTKIVHPFKAIYSWEFENNYKVIKEYKSEDPRLNQIFDTCKHTLELCMQNRIWDGIKRDRLVWIGDMEPEIHAIMHLYGNIEVVKETLTTAMHTNKMPCWINGIPSYSAWFLLIIYDIFDIAKDHEYVKTYEKYMNEIIHTFDVCLQNNDLDFDLIKLPYGMKNFIDWPSFRGDNEQERKDANVLLLQYIFPKINEMYKVLGLDNTLIQSILDRLNNIKVDLPQTKVFAAFYQLVNSDEKSYEILIKDNSHNMSTFMSYYVLKAVAQKDKNKAIELLKEYYGGMLDLGATSFFEDFNIDWVKESYRIDEINKGEKKDLHGDHGDHCYKGFRHSLCHGWSAGPISFLIEEKIK